MKKIPLTAFLILILLLTACTSNDENTVVIYSSAEGYRNEHYFKRLQEEFPDYEIILEYLSTGSHAAKLNAEGENSECDITLDLEYGYLEMLKDNLADISSYDSSVYLDDMLGDESRYFPEIRNSGAVVVNKDVLEEKGIEEPSTYKDLLKPDYKGLISMPSPKSSGTGYIFLKSLVNAWGENEAFQYFDNLSENILQYTSSGSGPINALVQGEVAVGLGMTAQAVTQMNEGMNFKILFFEEGAPYNGYGYGIINGKEEKQAVREVFEFLYSTLIEENNKLFFPEPIYKDKEHKLENYPIDITYANMENDTLEEKERLLDKWVY